MRALLFFCLFFSFAFSAAAQNIPINSWRTHISYNDGIYAQEVGNKVFVATTNGFYSVEKSDLSIQTYSKSDGFSDIFARIYEYSPQHNALFIAYETGNFDI